MVTVYLDSQDYSVLTDEKQLTPSLIELRERLIAYADSGLVTFVFSGTVISEIAPLSTDVGHLAIAKAKLILQLCGSAALVPSEKLIAMEIKSLAAPTSTQLSIVDPTGQWFSDISSKMGKSVWEELESQFMNDLSARGIDRQQRRAQAKNFFSGGRPLPAFLALLNQTGSQLLDGFHLAYPLQSSGKDVLRRYLKGAATDFELDQAIQAGMRDPHLLMQWFSASPDMSGPLAELVRKPGREIAALMGQLVEISKPYAQFLEQQNSTNSKNEFASAWKIQRAQSLCNHVRAFAQKMSISIPKILTVEQIALRCPGLTTMFGALYSRASANVVGGVKKTIGASLPVDTMHSMYAPYVDIFRTDREMAPFVSNQLRARETVVVSRRENLASAIEGLLKSKV